MIDKLPNGKGRSWRIVCTLCSVERFYSTESHPGIKAIIVREGWCWFRLAAESLNCCCPKCLPQLVIEAKRVTVEEASVEGLVNVK